MSCNSILRYFLCSYLMKQHNFTCHECNAGNPEWSWCAHLPTCWCLKRSKTTRKPEGQDTRKTVQHYSLSTWIESYNRHFSERNFEITDSEGNPIGYARTIWVVIDLSTRESQDISALQYIRENVSDKICPIDKLSKTVQCPPKKAVTLFNIPTSISIGTSTAYATFAC